MTTITAEDLTHQPLRRTSRRTIVSFIAGAFLASAVAIGVNVAVDDHPSTAASTPTSVPAPSSASGSVHFDGACPVVHGAC
jgi:hypothetical protein